MTMGTELTPTVSVVRKAYLQYKTNELTNRYPVRYGDEVAIKALRALPAMQNEARFGKRNGLSLLRKCSKNDMLLGELVYGYELEWLYRRILSARSSALMWNYKIEFDKYMSSQCGSPEATEKSLERAIEYYEAPETLEEMQQRELPAPLGSFSLEKYHHSLSTARAQLDEFWLRREFEGV